MNQIFLEEVFEEIVEVNVVDVVDNEIPISSEAGEASEQLNISVMEKKQGGGILLTPLKMTTRKRKMDSSFLSSHPTTPANGYKIIEFSILQDILNCVSKCTSCGKGKSLQLKQNNEKRNGLIVLLYLVQHVCKNIQDK